VTIVLGFTGTAVEGTNYSASPATITIASGASTGSTTLTGLNTGTTSNQDLTVSINSGMGAGTGSPSSATATLIGDQPSIYRINFVNGRRRRTDTITAHTLGCHYGGVTIDLGFTGSATQNTNFSASASSITIAADRPPYHHAHWHQHRHHHRSKYHRRDQHVSTPGFIGGTSSVSTTLTGDPTVNLSQSNLSMAEDGGSDTITPHSRLPLRWR